MRSRAEVSLRGLIWPYVQMCRIDHWFKNAFMFLGVVVAFLYRPDLMTLESFGRVGLALMCACLIASSNYVLNEYLDAPMDRLHPTKRYRPAALGLVSGPAALTLWIALAVIGIGLAFRINFPFGAAGYALWMMGCIYNIHPVRTKDLPYLDVLSEAVNNPLRLFLGWFALVPTVLPPLSLAIAYWMAGAFFMATKRFAEYRRIGDPERAGSYRASFRHYDEGRLLMSMAFYLVAGAVFAGVFIVRYKLELVFIVPVAAALFAYYVRLGLRQDSPVQAPEKLYREPLFMVFATVFVTGFVGLMLIDVPSLYELFNVQPCGIEPLWRIGR